jgi:hypothetical protein
MHAIAKLTPRRQRFADEYVLCGSGAEAARRAGYSEKTARAIAAELLTKPDVLSAIQALKAQNAAAFDVTRQDVIGGVLEAIAMARAAGDPGAMLTGLRDLSRMMGFNEPEAVRAVVVDTASAAYIAKFAAMSDAQLMAVVQGGRPLS